MPIRNTSFKNKALGWLALLLLAVLAFTVVAIPVWLIQPFAPQTARDVATAFALKSWSPIITAVAAVLSLILAFWLFSNSRRWWSKLPLILPLALIAFSVWFARQNHFEWMFNPLANSAYAKTAEVDFVGDEDMVLAVEENGEAVAYPVRLMAYHHLVDDRVGGTPLTPTY